MVIFHSFLYVYQRVSHFLKVAQKNQHFLLFHRRTGRTWFIKCSHKCHLQEVIIDHHMSQSHPLQIHATSLLWAHSRPSRMDPFKINKQSNSLDISMNASATVEMLTATAVVFAGPSSRPWRLRHRNRSPAVDFCSTSGWLRSNPRPVSQIQACLKWYPVRALAIRNKLKRGMKCQVPDTPIFPEKQIHKIMGVWQCLTFSTTCPDQIAGTWRSTSYMCFPYNSLNILCVLFELLWMIWGSTSYMDRPPVIQTYGTVWITCVLVWIGGMDPPVGSGYGSDRGFIFWLSQPYVKNNVSECFR